MNGFPAFENAEAAFAHFRSCRERGEDVSLDEYCTRYPELAEGLRWLDSIAVDADRPAAAESSDREPAGELTEVWKRFDDLGARVGDAIGPYALREEIGAGGFGTVFLASQTEPVCREVALKLLRAAASDALLARFRVECQALAAMEHTGIAQLIDAGVTERGQPYYVMELIRGVPLTAFCDEGSLSIEARLAVFVRICHAVWHAHSKGFLHRDLKPANVLVSAVEGEPPVAKVIDFGLAKVLDERFADVADATRAGDILGTPAYMSPEQIVDPLAADTRSDVYALGVMLFQLVTGALPFRSTLRGVSPAEIERVVAREDPLTPAEAVSRLGTTAAEVAARRGTDTRSLRRVARGDLGAIVAQAMARDPDRRYASAAALADDIERYLAHRPVAARTPGPIYTTRKFVRRHRLAVAAIGAIVAVGIIAIVTTRYLRAREMDGLARDAAAAIEHGDLDAARAKWETLRELTPGSRSEKAVGDDVVSAMIDRGEKAWGDHAAGERVVRDLESRLVEARKRRERWAPSWELADEIDLWTRARELRSKLDVTTPLRRLHEAYDLAGLDTDARRRAAELLEDVYLERYRDLQSGTAILSAAEALRRMVVAYGTGRHEDEVSGRATVRVLSDPPGARVHCFRYELVEGRRVPLPFHPGRGVVGDPFLRVERIWFEDGAGFRAGDRFVSVRGQAVRTRTDLAAALASVKEDESLPVIVRRDGTEVTLEWTPFTAIGNRILRRWIPEYEPGRIVHYYYQFGFTLAGYPLESLDDRLVGTTSTESAVELDLPRGSYLLVLTKDGHEETRYPVAAPRARMADAADRVDKIRLPAISEGPPDFVWIPSGDLATGGDPDAFQPFARGVRHVPGFFIGRLEVPSSEWLAFVNDTEVFARTTALGVLETPFLEEHRGTTVRIVPGPDDALYWTHRAEAGRWEIEKGKYPATRDVAVFHVSRPAAREFAAWKTRRAEAEGQPWRYRLPRDEEWERAARGVDRRLYPWGDFFVASHAWCWAGSFKTSSAPELGGVSPLDESVFGVRDLAGSSTEHTLGMRRDGFAVYRGGSWDARDEFFLRCATRNGLKPGGRYRHSGVRLVAEKRENPPGE